jgi:hypothetical protein
VATQRKASRKKASTPISRRKSLVKRPSSGRAPAKRARAARSAGRSTSRSKRKWSAEVSKRSDAMDLQPGVFKLTSARGIAQSLKKSAEASHRRKSTPFRSGMSMLNFEINRAGKGLSAARRRVLERAKIELRAAFAKHS